MRIVLTQGKVNIWGKNADTSVSQIGRFYGRNTRSPERAENM
jgi:hypothetical protein